MKRIVILFSLLISFFVSAPYLFAVGIGPAKFEISAAPGETIEDTVYVINTEKEPHYMSLEVNNSYYDRETNQTVYTNKELPRGLKKWIKLEKEISESPIDPGEKEEFAFTLDIPENADPGTYHALFFGRTSNEAQGEGVSKVGVSSRAGMYIILTIEGEVNESMELNSFDIDKNKLLKGETVFEIKIQNTGNVMLAPTGEITIYDQAGNQVNDVYAVTEKYEEIEVIKERKNFIPVNIGMATILPDATTFYNIPWENRNIDPGKYKAKLDLYYGENNTQLEAETDYFEITKSLILSDITPDSGLKASLPISFETTLSNNGSVTLSPTGAFKIENLFGTVKKLENLSEEELKIQGGDQKTIENTWDSGFAFGIYKAILELEAEGQEYSVSTTFWIINWWQAIIIVLVLAVLIFAIYKGLNTYLNMKKKLENMESGTQEDKK
jgi:hypothetical protein